jgi:hypothetical protein
VLGSWRVLGRMRVLTVLPRDASTMLSAYIHQEFFCCLFARAQTKNRYHNGVNLAQYLELFLRRDGIAVSNDE